MHMLMAKHMGAPTMSPAVAMRATHKTVVGSVITLRRPVITDCEPCDKMIPQKG
jgi:hypothetical protein